MSATVNPNSVEAIANQQEEQFSSRIPPSEPLTQKGHQPGRLTSDKDKALEFQAQTLPPGTAPKESTFQPNPSAVDPDSTTVAASDTIQGSTSADLHTGLGHPGQGQTSTEIRHDGAHGRKKQTHGLEGVGAGDRVPGMVRQGQEIDERDPLHADQRGLKRDDAPMGGRCVDDIVPAEERIPESAETVAREAPRD